MCVCGGAPSLGYAFWYHPNVYLSTTTTCDDDDDDSVLFYAPYTLWKTSYSTLLQLHTMYKGYVLELHFVPYIL